MQCQTTENIWIYPFFPKSSTILSADKCLMLHSFFFFSPNNSFKESFVKRTRRPLSVVRKKQKKNVCWTVFCRNTGTKKKKTDFSLFILKCFFFFFNFMFVLQIPSFYNTKMLVYNFNLCSSTLEMPDCVSSGTDGCCDHSIIPQQSGKSGLAFRLLTPLHLSGLAQVSAAAAPVGSFAPMTGGDRKSVV